MHGCWKAWVFHIDCNSATGGPCQQGHNLPVRSLDIRTKTRYAAQDHVGRYSLGNLYAMLLKVVLAGWSCHQHRERGNTRSQCWDVILWWEAGVHAHVPLSAHLCLYTAAQQATAEEYCGSWLWLAGEWPLTHCAFQASGRSLKIYC